jgi:hypothetical protein
MDPKPNPEYHITIAPSGAAATAQRVVAELTHRLTKEPFHHTITHPSVSFTTVLRALRVRTRRASQ